MSRERGVPYDFVVRDGIEDYAYAKALERALARRADKGDAWAREARRLLNVPPSVMDTLKNFTDSADAVYSWRDRMADLLEESTGTMR